MTSLENRHPLAGLAEGLKLNYPELGILVDSVCQKASPYDFFRVIIATNKIGKVDAGERRGQGE